MIQIIKKKDCCGCYACATICPQQCIDLKEDNEGFNYPIIDLNKCTNCDLCNSVCPIINREVKLNSLPVVFACKNKNDEIRMESSSGGIFSLLAEQFINLGGVVFGARFDTDFSVTHDFTETTEGLSAFRGSKYLQSLIKDNYKKAKQFLKQGRHVLFTGTPCQIAGLKHFLHKEYDNLLAVDIACHGVPSPKVFRLYLEEINSHQEGKLEKIQFRDKTEGWKKFSFATKRKIGKNSASTRETLDKNIFMRGFLQNLYLRPSCHFCPSKNFSSGSDLTIADFWGIQKTHPEFDDDKGCSLILCNTLKGGKSFASIKNKTSFIETTIDNALAGNLAIVISVKPHSNREKFFEKLDSISVQRLIKYYTKSTNKELFRLLIYSILRKMKIIAIYKHFKK